MITCPCVMKFILFILLMALFGCGDPLSLHLGEMLSDDENENPCSLPPESGTCGALFFNYFYNTSSEACEIFIYGGCGGNKNNFQTEEDCMDRCEGGDIEAENSDNLIRVGLSSNLDKMDDCDYPKKAGSCKANHKRFYFNGQTCEEFVFGGCQGNPNNFRTKKQCIEKCGHRIDTGSGESEDEVRLSLGLF